MNHKNIKFENHNKRNTLGMNTQVYKALLDKLDSANDPAAALDVKRVYTRLEYIEPHLEIMLETSDRMQRTITVATRNISKGGMSVLHSSFVYTGTTVSAKLTRTDDTTQQIRGKVIRCNHRGGVVHEIGIQFDTEIIVQQFIRPDINDSLRSRESVTPEELTGKLLVVGKDQSILPFVREYLQSTNVNYGFADNAAQAMEKKPEEYDIVLSCLDVEDMSGPEFAQHLRETGFHKPIILSGAGHEQFTQQQIRLSSADMFLPVPITQNSLMCALGEYLLTQWTQKTLETIRSGVDRDTVVSLRNELAKLGVVLDQQIRTEDAVQIYATCSKIRSIAPLLGMKSLRDITKSVGESVASNGDLQEHTEALNDIRLICAGMTKAA
jgi:CheY-like chemotaxis protein